ncbi:ribosome recycling factor domain-containing protein, partial [Geopyxis carbonaria]
YDADVELSKLEGEITKISERLQEDLAKLRAGSTDPSVLGKLDVVIDKAAHTVVQLREVAHVVTKGRALAVTVYETTNVKKVISAIQIADLNMQPVLDAKNPQLVNVPLPPPTKESRLEVVEKMVAAGNKAQDGLRNARAKTRKGLQSAERDMRPDDVKKVTKRLEDVVKARKTELESVVEKAKKAAM